MRTTIHQPNYLPYSGFFNKLKDVELFIIFDKSKFTKNDFHQRNKIRVPEGWRYLTIPISREFHDMPMNEVEFIDDKFKKRHIDIIHQYYHKAPFYACYEEEFKKLYGNPTNKLSEFNISIINYLIKVIGIEIEIKISSKMDVDFSLKGNDINLELLKATKSNYYLSGIMGKNYIDMGRFKEAGIKVEFQNFTQREYPQLYTRFIPNMSVIDLLFNIGEKTIEYI